MVCVSDPVGLCKLFLIAVSVPRRASITSWIFEGVCQLCVDSELYQALAKVESSSTRHPRMKFPPQPQRSIPVRLTAATTLAAFLVASVGYPLWSGEGKDLSKPFPCMHRACGCRSAEQCWRGCCCFSNRQKLAWARENKVTPPDYVAAAAARESEARPTGRSCCSTKKGCLAPTGGVQKDIGGSSLINVIEALTCMTHLEQWVAIGAIDVVHSDPWQVDFPLVGRVALRCLSYDSLTSDPATPPPLMATLSAVVA